TRQNPIEAELARHHRLLFRGMPLVLAAVLVARHAPRKLERAAHSACIPITARYVGPGPCGDHGIFCLSQDAIPIPDTLGFFLEEIRSVFSDSNLFCVHRICNGVQEVLWKTPFGSLRVGLCLSGRRARLARI